MKNNKKSIKISLSTFFLIIAIVIIVIMGLVIFKLYNDYYIGFEKSENQLNPFNTAETSPTSTANMANTINTANTTNELSSNKSEDSESNAKPFVFSFMGGIAIVDDGNVYVRFKKEDYLNMEDGAGAYYKNYYGNNFTNLIENTEKKYKEYKFDSLGYSEDPDNSSFLGLKLDAKDIIKVCTNSNSDMPENYCLVLLNKDGTVSAISIYSLINGKTNTTKINGLSGIKDLSFETTYDSDGMTDAIGYVAINASGEKIFLDDYIPKNYKDF